MVRGMLRRVRSSRCGRVGKPAAALLPTLALALGCAPEPPPAVAPRPLSPAEVIDSVVSTPPLERTHWGVAVADANTGRVLHARQPEKHFRPASNNKLVVTAVALAELGPDYRYRTPVWLLEGASPTAAGAGGRRAAAGRAAGDSAGARDSAFAASGVEDAPPAGDSIAGGLLVAGRGDPTLSERFHPSDFAALDSLADSLALRGVRRIAGDLVVDASYFDSVHVHPTWEVDDLPWYYAAPVAAFGVAEGAFPVEVAPGPAPGEPARLDVLVPDTLVRVRSRLVTDTAGARRVREVARFPAGDSIVIAGRIPLDRDPDTLWLAVLDPALYAGRALALSLERRGIALDGRVRVLYDSAAAAAVHERAPDIVWTSPPMREIVAGILKPSQNWMAEQVLKTLGAEREGRGSWRAGVEVEERYLFDVVGIDSAAVVLRDGSGLSAQNLLTPGAVARLLLHARDEPWGPVYRAALAEPGAEGTLERRLEALEGRLFAKTGTITHVNALSGYLASARGRELVFSILTDASGRPSREVRRAIDRIIRAIADEGGSR